MRFLQHVLMTAALTLTAISGAAEAVTLPGEKPVVVLNGTVEIGKTPFEEVVNRLKQTCPKGIKVTSGWDNRSSQMMVLADVQPSCFGADDFNAIWIRNYFGKVGAVFLHYASDEKTFQENSDVLTQKYGQTPTALGDGSLLWALPDVNITNVKGGEENYILYETRQLTDDAKRAEEVHQQNEAIQKKKNLL